MTEIGKMLIEAAQPPLLDGFYIHSKDGVVTADLGDFIYAHGADNVPDEDVMEIANHFLDYMRVAFPQSILVCHAD